MEHNIQQLKASLEQRNQLHKTLLSNNLSSFIRRSFNSINPGIDYMHNWHIDLMAELMEQITENNLKRVIINIPPRYLKSICVSVAWPAWLLGNDPTRRIIVASYAQNLSTKHSQDCRLLMNCNWYNNLFPNARISDGENQKEKFVTTQRGFRFATSVHGSVTGEGGDFIIVDDPHNPIDIMNDKTREGTINWFEQVLTSRLNDKKKGVIVLVMQRLHDNDLAGHLLSKPNSPWVSLSLPAISEDSTYYHLENYHMQRNEGNALHDSRENLQDLDMVKNELGSYTFAAQYQQNPLKVNRGYVKSDWLQYYNTPPDNHKHIIQSWDTAIKTGGNNDFSVGTCWAVTNDGYYLLDIIRAKLEFPALKQAIVEFANKWQVDTVLIEDKASGQSLLQELRQTCNIPLVAIMPKLDKLSRFMQILPLFEAGRIHLPTNTHWLDDYAKELQDFPHVKHDDQIDSTSQFLNWYKSTYDSNYSIRRV